MSHRDREENIVIVSKIVIRCTVPCRTILVLTLFVSRAHYASTVTAVHFRMIFVVPPPVRSLWFVLCPSFFFFRSLFPSTLWERQSKKKQTKMSSNIDMKTMSIIGAISVGTAIAGYSLGQPMEVAASLAIGVCMLQFVAFQYNASKAALEKKKFVNIKYV